MHNLQEGVREFMLGAGDTVGKFNPDQACRYMGYQIEEMAEKIKAAADGALNASDRAYLMQAAANIDALGKQFKAGEFVGAVGRADHDKLIDADFDLAFTSLGALNSTSIDTDGAIHEGCRSNLAKLVDGKVIRDAHGKIQKPAGWTPPDFRPFVDPNVKGD